MALKNPAPKRLASGSASEVWLLSDATTGKPFVRKQGIILGGRRGDLELRLQVRHLRAVGLTLGERNPYPDIFRYDPTHSVLDMEYVPGPNLFLSGPRSHCSAAEIAVMLDHIALSRTITHRFTTKQEAREVYLQQLQFRCRRWLDLKLPPTVEQRLFQESAVRVLGLSGAWADALAPELLGLAVHADFVPDNVIIEEHNQRPRYIDPRGANLHWVGGVPFWDIAIDLCSLLMFTFVCPRLPLALDVVDYNLLFAHLRQIASEDEGFWRRISTYAIVRYIGYAHVLLSNSIQDPRLLPILVERLDSVRSVVGDIARLDAPSAETLAYNLLGPATSAR